MGDSQYYVDAPQNDPSMNMMPPPMNYGMTPQLMQQDPNIASMRWEGQTIINELYRILGGYDIKTDENNNVRYERKNNIQNPRINDIGLESLASTIYSNVNPVVSLSRLEEDKANELIRQTLYTIEEELLLNQQKYEIEDKNLYHIYSIIKTLVYCQVMRAVDGHESKNFRTQTMEQTQNMNMPTQNNKGGLWSSMFGRR